VTPRPAPPPDLAGRWLAKFFTDHLAGERAASPRTVSSYRDAAALAAKIGKQFPLMSPWVYQQK